jgi:SAM-dependent methyltransferase
MSRRMTLVVALCAGLLACAWSPSRAQEARKPDVIYVPTSHEAVAEMLRITDVGKDDIVYDLGCGDGRIVVAAVKEYGAKKAVGIDIDPQRIQESNENAQEAGVTDRVTFLEQDLFQTDFGEATVVTLYLLDRLNVRLRPQLFQQLRPGTRIVSHDFTMGEWKDDQTVEVDGDEASATLHYWVLPAPVAGIWRWTPPGGQGQCVLRLHQQFQEVWGTVTIGGSQTPITDAKLVGEQLSFTVARDVRGQRVTASYAGSVSGRTIRGGVTVQGGSAAGEHQWTAQRNPGGLAGTWRWAEGASGAITVRNRDGRLAATSEAKGERSRVPHFYAYGGGFHFELPGNREDASVLRESYEGIVEGDRVIGRITARTQASSGQGAARDWEAQREK